MAKIDELITETQDRLQNIQHAVNHHMQEIKRKQQELLSLQREGDQLSARLNALTEVQALGLEAFGEFAPVVE